MTPHNTPTEPEVPEATPQKDIDTETVTIEKNMLADIIQEGVEKAYNRGYHNGYNKGYKDAFIHYF